MTYQEIIDLTRRRFLGLGVGAAATLPWALSARSATAVRAARLRAYIEPLPLPGSGIVVAAPSGLNRYTFTQTQIRRRLHPDLPPTPLWAYDDGAGLTG